MSSEGSSSAGRCSQPASDSQASSISNWSDLQLSQGSVNTVLNAVGLSGLEGDRFIQVCASEVNNDEEEEGDPVTGLASVSVSRTVIHASSVPQYLLPVDLTLSDLNNSTLLSLTLHQSRPPSPPPHPHIPLHLPHTLHTCTLPTDQRDNISCYDVESPLVCYDPIPTPPATLPQVPIAGPSGSHFPVPNTYLHTYNLQSKYPSNVPLTTEYKFEFVTVVDNKRSPYSKSAHITFSEQTDRLYLKQDVVLPLHFSVARAPPVGAVVRVMTIYKAPEVIAQNIICCPKHIELQKQDGVLFPHHFIRCKNEGAVYYENPITRRTSVSMPFSTLQETHPRHRSPPPPAEPQCLYAGLFHFPCHTSELQHGGRHVQLIFTLERGGEVLGRCVRDVRVCSSPGRDREKDESKVAKQQRGGDPPSSDDPPPAKRARKRALPPSTEAEVHQCTLPSATQLCQDTNEEKVPHTVWTYRRLIPFVDVCVRMMEGVCNPVWVANGNGNQEQQEPSSTTITTQEVAEWLEGAGLGRYTDMLKRQGVEHTFQALAVTEQELRRWGMTNPAHRKQFLEAKSRIQTADRQPEPLRTADKTPGTPPLFSSQSPPPPPPLSQGSQGSQPGTQPFGTTARFEVVQIQMRKHIGSASQQ